MVRSYTYSYERGILESVETTIGVTTLQEGYALDFLGRLTSNTVSLNGDLSFAYGYTYTETDTTTSGQIANVTVEGSYGGQYLTDSYYTYTYDDNGNITRILRAYDEGDAEEYRYYYDTQGQLIREDN